MLPILRKGWRGLSEAWPRQQRHRGHALLRPRHPSQADVARLLFVELLDFPSRAAMIMRSRSEMTARFTSRFFAPLEQQIMPRHAKIFAFLTYSIPYRTGFSGFPIFHTGGILGGQCFGSNLFFFKKLFYGQSARFPAFKYALFVKNIYFLAS